MQKPKSPTAGSALAPRCFALDDASAATSSRALTTPSHHNGASSLPVPFGFPSRSTDSNYASSSVSSGAGAGAQSPAALAAERADKIYQSAMATAKQPGSQLLMTGFMLWMSGNALQIFSIMTLGMALFQPLQRLFEVNNTFAKYNTAPAAPGDARAASVSLLVPKLVWIALNVAGVALALYKARAMGLVPSWEELITPTPAVPAAAVLTVLTDL